MDRVRFTLYLLLLCSAKAALARFVSESEVYSPREYPCPTEEDIAPCTCNYDPETYALTMDCSEVRSDDELIAAFDSTFPFPTVETLIIDQTDDIYNGNILETLSQDSFGDVSFVDVDIRGTTITTVEEGAFQNSHETLISLRLPTNEISSFTFEVIGEFTALTHLVLSGNQFDGQMIDPISSYTLRVLNLDNNPNVVIEGDFVRFCPALRQFLLRNTGQTALPLLPAAPISMINGLNDILQVDFSSNSISILESNSFVQDTEDESLTTLNLSNNDISIVFPNFVTGLVDSDTTLLDLSSNSIELLDEAVWRDIFLDIGIGTINLADNPLTCGCEIAWLVDSPSLMDVLTDETLCLTGNPVNELPSDAFDDCP